MLLHSLVRKMTFLLAISMALFSLSSCTTVSPETKAGLRKIVVLNAASTEVKRFHIGFTAFTNKGDMTSRMPELRTQLNSLLLQELTRRLPHAQIIFDDANAQRLAGVKGPSQANAVYASAAQNASADALIVVDDHAYYPYGVPSNLAAENGLWHGGNLEGGSTTAESFVSVTLIDGKTNKVIGSGWPKGAVGTTTVPFPPKGADYQGADRAKVVEALMKSISAKIVSNLDQSGL
jgi:hypothetical protein